MRRPDAVENFSLQGARANQAELPCTGRLWHSHPRIDPLLANDGDAIAIPLNDQRDVFQIALDRNCPGFADPQIKRVQAAVGQPG